MQTSVMILAALVVSLAPPASSDDTRSGDERKLLCAWEMIREVEDGKEVEIDTHKRAKLTFARGGRWKVEVDGKVIGEGTAVLDTGKMPKTIDYTFTAGEQKGAKFLAIYKLDPDRFEHCGVLKGDRPAEFSSKPGSGRSWTVFRRVKQ
jgi:uncharacterized protein (TIGR03067 family)